MENKREIKSIFSVETLDQVPVFYRFMTESETRDLGELKVGARFSKCASHFSDNYLNFWCHKPISDIDTSKLYNEF